MSDLHDAYAGARQPKRLEVRCCCNPNKVLGTIAHPRLQQPGDVWWFMVLDNTKGPDILVVPGRPDLSHHRPAMKRLELQVSEFSDGRGIRRTAVKNNDYPLEELRLVPGFQPATWEPWS